MRAKTALPFSITGKLTLPVLFLLIATMAVGQKTDTSQYLPQINLTATNGFGPYIIGTGQENTILADALPANTSKVMFRFIDADSLQVGSAYVITGSSLSSVSWHVQLDTFKLPLSPQLQIELTYDPDSIASYYIPYTVYPDTVIFQATKGWGPFFTNAYPLSDTSWSPVLQLTNNFMVKNLPPRTDTVVFQIVTNDSIVIRTLTVIAPAGTWLDSAKFSNVRMDNLPLATSYLRVIIHANGAPVKGLEFYKNLTTALQKPKLTSTVEGITLHDSIAVVPENPVSGQALLIDSVKYASITNGPGIKNMQAPYNYRGPYSIDILNGPFTIECWIKIDTVKITKHANATASFIRVDSLFDIGLCTSTGLSKLTYLQVTSLLGGEVRPLYSTDATPALAQNGNWHHIAFEMGDPNDSPKIYIDGTHVATYTNSINYNYLLNYYPNYKSLLRTKPLLIGGVKAILVPHSPDYSLITAMDDIRIWDRYLTDNEVMQNYNKVILQDTSLTGYWNFDDLRNRLHFISDLSYMNNSGTLGNGAAFIPENPDMYRTNESLVIASSNSNTDSVQFAFINEDNRVVDSVKLKVQNHKVQLQFDISSLSYTVNYLRIKEIYPGSLVNGNGNVTFYPLKIIPPAPVPTPQTNWGTFYNSGSSGTLSDPVLVNGLPENTTKLILGLHGNNLDYNLDTSTINSVPYQYSLALNGTDNYIQTSQYIDAPKQLEMSLWFKTTTTAGGRLIGFSDSQNGISYVNHDRDLLMQPDGSLRFVYYNESSSVTLYASNKYNDGNWHCITVDFHETTGANLYVDNSLVDWSDLGDIIVYPGYWVIGRYDPSKSDQKPALANYFKGSLAYINIVTYGDDVMPVRDANLENGAHRGNLLYRLDEGTGSQIHDYQGNNPATLQGTTQNWSKTNKISMVRWDHNMLDKPDGNYSFFAKVFYPGGGEQGVFYPLGYFNIKNPLPLPGYYFSYNLLNGNGYFNEGSFIPNPFFFNTNYTGQSHPGWIKNFVRYLVLTPEHIVVDTNIYTWTSSGGSSQFVIDMGEVPPGSYLDVQIGYATNTVFHTISSMTIPILIRPMMAPTVSGDFGPFEQAIAPGTMAKQNTFNIFEENLTDLSKVVGTFYDINGNVIATANGVHVNDTTWQITENMAMLSPPETYLKISYYLGSNNYLALVAGPYRIDIHKTRPDWFDVVGDSAFSNINESGDIVTFQVTTPFDASYMINNSTGMDIPGWVPLIGNSSCEIDMPTGQAYLKYTKSESKLSLNQPPNFFQKVFNLGAGNSSTLSFTFNSAQSNSFNLDDKNNLFADQNFSTGGSITSGFDKLANIAEKIEEIIQAAEVVDPGSVIVKPSFEITYTGSFEYSSRLHLMIDTLTGKWGSYGNLNVDANPNHTEAFKNSSSYHFYSGALGMEFGVGAELLEGLVSGHFGLDGRFLLGFGQSYVTIPSYQSKPLKSFAFQTYGRFYIDILWGWYEKTVWGPKMFYSTTIWGDDMTNAFPPMGKKKTPFDPLPAHSSWPELAKDVRPVSSFSRIPFSSPQSTVQVTDNNVLFNWLEKGEDFGERNLRGRYLYPSSHRFSEKYTIENNHNAMNSPVSDVSGDSLAILVWAQSRHTENTFTLTGTSNPMQEFVKSQDIWFAIYDLGKDTLLQINMLEDDLSTYTSGRAEANPKITLLSSIRAMITWQVVNLAADQADIWYTCLEKNGTQWTQTLPAIAVSGTDVKTQIQIYTTAEDKAVMVWLSTSKDGLLHSMIESSVFNGTTWSNPELISGPDEYYCNYLDLCFRGDKGGLVYTKFVEDTVNGHHEKLILIPWSSDHWNKTQVVELLVDSVNHLQLPKLAIFKDGIAAVAIKREKMTTKSENQRISEIDIFKGDLNQPSGVWHYSEANPFICDTTRQVSELNLAFINKDTLLLLNQEYPMLAVNAASVPLNGIVFGDPYMNQVLRCFSMREDGNIEDVDEQGYFLGIPEPEPHPDNFNTLQCYPNPCVDHTTVRFNLSESSQITLEIYDIRGNKVATLIHLDLGAGLYEIDLNTSLLEPGTYICRLQAKEAFCSLKIVVGK
jgi:hypothetical protein